MNIPAGKLLRQLAGTAGSMRSRPGIYPNFPDLYQGPFLLVSHRLKVMEVSTTLGIVLGLLGAVLGALVGVPQAVRVPVAAGKFNL